MKYNFNDPAIREMVKTNHRPKEQILKTPEDKIILHEITCEGCRIKWPCPSIVEIREWDRIHSTREPPGGPWRAYFDQKEDL